MVNFAFVVQNNMPFLKVISKKGKGHPFRHPAQRMARSGRRMMRDLGDWGQCCFLKSFQLGPASTLRFVRDDEKEKGCATLP